MQPLAHFRHLNPLLSLVISLHPSLHCPNPPCLLRQPSERQIVVGICSMMKKSNSKPMTQILERLCKFDYIDVVIFPEEVILEEPVEKWPLCDCLISFHSKGKNLQLLRASCQTSGNCNWEVEGKMYPGKFTTSERYNFHIWKSLCSSFLDVHRKLRCTVVTPYAPMNSQDTRMLLITGKVTPAGFPFTT